MGEKYCVVGSDCEPLFIETHSIPSTSKNIIAVGRPALVLVANESFSTETPETRKRYGARISFTFPADGVLRVACGSGCVRLAQLQAPGKRRMEAAAFVSGRELVGHAFGHDASSA